MGSLRILADKVFSSHELKAATSGFHSSNKVGEGGFGTVFKGRLRDGTLVAVKVLSIELESMRGEREFISELTALSDIRHENLVKLRGCCVEGASRYLVYDYMENNSLTQTLLGGEQTRKNFTWDTRRAISLGVARGLAHLHEEVQPHIVHRDIKASNILLDKKFIPKVGDFGLSKLLRDGKSHISTHVAGTIGYLAPEYAISGRLTRKSDVYSFGVLLLEIVSGRQVVIFDMERGEHYLVQKAWEAHKANKLLQLVDPTLAMNFPDNEAIRFIKVGLLCVQQTARLRPLMSEAVKMLTNEIDIEDVEISQPGVVTDLMKIKMGQQHSSQTSSVFSNNFTTISYLDPYTSDF
ncbi:putative serine/threonine-protein kinase isoform X2 [Ziziphus jujuba]|uniref:Serine/threonine-protein kinase isoform X2 n=1 Tax=Ziziphus jujuba TaxID=326968 RepID=A0A6P4AXX3_ZIZJJ|nr:putative serine/threonine-protein kinase isoform X2 [Ziziphus jujuba]